MAAVTIHSDFGAQENKIFHCFPCFPICLPRSDGTRCHDIHCLILRLKDCLGFCLMVIQSLLQIRSLYPYSQQADGVAEGSFRELHLLLFLRELEADTEARSLLKPTSLISAAVATPRHAGTWGRNVCSSSLHRRRRPEERQWEGLDLLIPRVHHSLEVPALLALSSHTVYCCHLVWGQDW